MVVGQLRQKFSSHNLKKKSNLLICYTELMNNITQTQAISSLTRFLLHICSSFAVSVHHYLFIYLFILYLHSIDPILVTLTRGYRNRQTKLILKIALITHTFI